MKGLWLLISVSCYYLAHTQPPPQPIDDSICTKDVCNAGYVNKEGAARKWWACGVDCPGGKYYTDGYCNCACVSSQECQDECKHSRGPCNAGMWDITNGNWNWWSCGDECTPKFYTDGVCNCACQDKPDVCPDGTTCGGQGPCDAGYMDKTSGNYKRWACGADCAGGKYYTDGVCNCACVPAGQCALTPSYHNFNLYRYVPQLAFIRYFGVLGEYFAITLIIGLICLLLYKGYKKYKIKGKKMYFGKIMEDESDVEEVEEAEKDPINNDF